MHSIDISKRSIGITFTGEQGNVSLWAPHADIVELLTDHHPPVRLVKQEYGYWSTTIRNLKPGDRYQFLLNNQKKIPDPASLAQPDGVHGLSQALEINAFEWTDHTWKNPPLTDYIIYELHTGTFTVKGTFEGICEKLDHLKSLGITAIELMPVVAFPGDRNWGYDGVFPFAVHLSYGGAEQLQQLVTLCHEKGLAVVLDVVYNHLGPEGNYLPEFGPYLTDKYKTPWGKAINFDDAGCDGVRAYFLENAMMWFRDFHVDALRLDAVHAIKDFSPTHFLRELRMYTNKLMERTGRIHHLIIECDLNDSRFIDPLEKQGYAMDAQWCDEFHHALRVAGGQQTIGYYSDFNGVEHLAKAYRDTYVYNGIYSPHRQKTFGNDVSRHNGEQFIVFSQNHDQIGNRMLGERTSCLVSFEMQKLMAGAVVVSPFIPLLFMGEEWAEKAPFQYFVSHTDPELAEAVRKGRKEEFKSFQSQDEFPDPLAEQTFNRSKLNWNAINNEPHATMLRFYKLLISIRTHFLPLHLFKRNQLDVNCDPKQQTLQLRRWRGPDVEKNQLICLMNFSKQAQQFQLPENYSWNKLLCSSDQEWLGSHNAPESITKEITLSPESISIYTNHHV
jgi:maltooligosyltrehalose trehalohydrolase